MTQRYTVQKLLHTASDNAHFLNMLTISEEEHGTLKMLRRQIRGALKQGFKQIRDKAQSSDSEAYRYIAQLEPKFWTQGSFAYETLNDPAHVPPQQIDLDDGVYFPMEFAEGNPRAANKLLFSLVDNILQDLAKANDWGFDDSKDTCARLNINQRIHIDIPIYAIPQVRYAALKESMEARKMAAEFAAEAGEAAQPVDWLDPNEVYLAIRGAEHWKPSDPMKLHRWFKSECDLHPRRLRRVCRYLKAWRDHTWPKGGPSSITLMVAAAQTFDANLNSTRSHFDTDCQALLAVVRALPVQFSGEITNPAEENEVMFPRGQTEHELSEIRAQVQMLKDQVEAALCEAATNVAVVQKLRQAFGVRMPDRPDNVEARSVAAAVRKVPVQPQRKPEPPRSQRSASPSFRSA